jgi:small nuclear ribonucleoprotein (snRNP)-like protein
MKNHICKLATIICLCCLSTWVYSQDTTNYEKFAGKIVNIKTKEGKEFSGRVLELDKTNIGILLDNKEMLILPISEIATIDFDKKIGSGNLASHETYATRYVITPSYLRMEKGDNYGRFAIWGAELEFAMSKRFTLGMMMTWLGSPMAINGKIAFPVSEKVHLGFGCLLGWGGLLFPSGLTALPFGGITFGDARSNFTLTGGYGISSFLDAMNANQSGTQLAFGLSGMKKTKDGATLVFESIVIPFVPGSNQPSIFITPALRFHRKNTRSFQAGVLFMMVDGKVVPTPIPTLSWLFKMF